MFAPSSNWCLEECLIPLSTQIFLIAIMNITNPLSKASKLEVLTVSDGSQFSEFIMHRMKAAFTQSRLLISSTDSHKARVSKILLGPNLHSKGAHAAGRVFPPEIVNKARLPIMPRRIISGIAIHQYLLCGDIELSKAGFQSGECHCS